MTQSRGKSLAECVGRTGRGTRGCKASGAGRNPFQKAGLAVLIALTVGACGDPDLTDLEQSVEEVARTSTLDTIHPGSRGTMGFTYGAMGERSPFEPFAEIRGRRATTAPDPARPRQAPEFFPLGQLEMVGTLAGRGKVVALIRDPEGNTHSLAVGDYLGRDHGRITSVRDTRIDILELVEDDRGGWTARARALELSVADASEESPQPGPDDGNGGMEE